uniref:Uncharacterized protein n=1 Tax=Boutonnet virus TaxID=1807816 RepID=A0A140HES8_9VIRU|nr:hypothetical protein [Boutonnet virus]
MKMEHIMHHQPEMEFLNLLFLLPFASAYVSQLTVILNSTSLSNQQLFKSMKIIENYSLDTIPKKLRATISIIDDEPSVHFNCKEGTIPRDESYKQVFTEVFSWMEIYKSNYYKYVVQYDTEASSLVSVTLFYSQSNLRLRKKFLDLALHPGYAPTFLRRKRQLTELLPLLNTMVSSNSDKSCNISMTQINDKELVDHLKSDLESVNIKLQNCENNLSILEKRAGPKISDVIFSDGTRVSLDYDHYTPEELSIINSFSLLLSNKRSKRAVISNPIDRKSRKLITPSYKNKNIVSTPINITIDVPTTTTTSKPLPTNPPNTTNLTTIDLYTSPVRYAYYAISSDTGGTYYCKNYYELLEEVFKNAGICPFKTFSIAHKSMMLDVISNNIDCSNEIN